MFKSVLLDMLNKPAQSVIILAVLISIFSFELLGLSLYDSASNKEIEVQEQIGATLEIYSNPEYIQNALNEYIKENNTSDGFTFSSYIDEDLIIKINTIEHIKGCNALSGYFAVPDNFENIQEYTGADITKQIAEDISDTIKKENVIIDGNLDCQYAESFRKGYSKLISGTFPNKAKKGALLEKKLADKNNLSIGDTIKVHNPEDPSISLSLEIVGIYETTEFFEVLDTNFFGEDVLAYNPCNRIYCDYDSGLILTNSERKFEYIEIYVDNANNAEIVITNIQSLDLEWERFVINNLSSEETKEVSSMLSEIMDNAKYIILLSIIFGTVILALVISFWSKSELYEAGVYMALGESKIRIIFKKIIYIFILILVALTFSFIISNFTTDFMTGNFVIKYPDSLVGQTLSFRTTIPKSDEILLISLNYKDMVLCALSGLIFSVVAMVGFIFNIIHKKTNSILRKEVS